MNINQSETNCPATTLIADVITSFTADCGSCLAVYSSNVSLKQTAAKLFDVLENDETIKFSNESLSLGEADSNQEWCFVLKSNFTFYPASYIVIQ